MFLPHLGVGAAVLDSCVALAVSVPYLRVSLAVWEFVAVLEPAV